MKKKTNPLFHSLRLGIIVIIAVVIYAYGFQVTKMGFEEIYSPTRQRSLTRVIRTLFHPDIVEFDQIQTQIDTPFYTPCPDSAVVIPEPEAEKSYLVVTPSCAEPRAEITVEGFNFRNNSRGQVYFIPPSGVNLGLGTYETDDTGYFLIKAKVPPRPSDQVQTIRTVMSQNVGRPRLSKTAYDTWDKIIETVFLALLATTFGIILAVPVSFLAARNIMRDITLPMNGLSLTLLGWPIGMWLGGTVASWLGSQSERFTENPTITLISIAVIVFVIWLITRWALPEEEETVPGIRLRIGRLIGITIAVLLGILALYLLASLAIATGKTLAREPGFIGMMGSFVENMGVILELLIAVVAAFMGGGVVSNFLVKLGRRYIVPLPKSTRLIVNFVLAAMAGALVGVIFGAAINWIYQINNPLVVFFAPALVGAGLGILGVYKNREKDSLPIGLTIYFITRTILNALRAIEALIWVIIFVVWVGIGPFAGVLALALHTIAALGKLYSEQVESISPGPLEAVKATGATRLQVIIYSVIPQIIPLYISFTMYRWDINVRMSTIIGFAGGGGIGFLLLQNINLLNYRAASTQMIAIAIVVAAMDYLSSYMRERIV